MDLETPHTCHARGCSRVIDVTMLMCRRHWFMVPPHIRAKVWATYRPGQEKDKLPSREWHSAADLAIAAVAKKEGRLQ